MARGPLAPDVLRRYAEAVVGEFVGLRRGESLLLECGPAHRELAVAISEAAYRAGAGLVDVAYDDPRVTRARVAEGPGGALGRFGPWHRARLRAASDPGSAFVRIVGEEEPALLSRLDPGRVAADLQGRARARRAFLRALVAHRVRWCIVAWPTPAWARLAYPELTPARALSRLGEDIVWFCRLGPDDPPGAWTEHARRIGRRAGAVTRRRFAGLEFRGPGTRLDVALAPDGRWLGGGATTDRGRRFFPNVPTEEVFTSPDPRGTSGTFRCTTPLSFGGRVIEGIAGEFRRGRLVRIEAARGDDRDLLEATLATDRGAGRLGEVALVDRGSRVGRAGRVYGDSLLDENAAAHMAFGEGFAEARRDGGPVNRSRVHLDVMIGSGEVEVTGVGARGRRVPVIAGGEWRLSE
jgi:aminopeptidase